MPEHLHMRPARSDELSVMRAIDDESGPMYLAAGVNLGTLDHAHPFVLEESARWLASLVARRVQVAEVAGEVVGFSVLDTVDGAPYLDQLSVAAAWMRQGVGSALLRKALDASRAEGVLWLTTYAQLAWNGPYYQRFGFRQVPESECGADVLAILAKQRAVMPFPEQRIAMACAL
jgi:GNAT superfamily N-acetyltransferase